MMKCHCGNTEFVQTMRLVSLMIGAQHELQVAGIATVLVCTTCKETMIPWKADQIQPGPGNSIQMAPAGRDPAATAPKEPEKKRAATTRQKALKKPAKAPKKRKRIARRKSAT